MRSSSTQNLSPATMAMAKTVASSLVHALKMLSLYPEDHAYCRTTMTRLQNDLRTFLNNYKELVLHVERDQLLFKGKVVYQGAAKDGDLAFALFRDSVLSLGFQQGVDSREINTLIRILARYKSLPPEPEGDIVTALWEARLPYIRYEAADHISEPDAERALSLVERIGPELPRLKPLMGTSTFTSGEIRAYSGGSGRPDCEIEDLPELAPISRELTVEEARKLEQLVRDQEEKDPTQDVLNTMADILKNQLGEEFLDAVLEYVGEELRAALGRKDFDTAFRTLGRLHQVRQLCKKNKSWALSKINKFFLGASWGDFLAPLKGIWSVMNASEIEKARSVLLLLPSGAIGALGPMMLSAASSPVEKMLSDVIVSLGSRSVKTFEGLLDTAEEDLVCRLVPLLARMDGDRIAGILVKMAHHSSERVRKESIESIAACNLWIPEKLIALMDDESGVVRQLFMKYLGSRRSEAAERLLLDYLQNRSPRGRDGKCLVAYFRTLGKCGTPRSIPFLQDVLLKGGWISKFFPSTRRRGAAIALMELGTGEARRVVDEASKSRYPGIRGAALAAM